MNPKKSPLIICVGLLALLTIGCARHAGPAPRQPDPPGAGADERRYSDRYGPPVKLAELADRSINESSGLVASRRNPGLFWTHNDSGDGPFIYALDRAGKSAGVWRVTGAEAVDWEDIAAGPGPDAGVSYLYMGDIGDNEVARAEVVVYRLTEPAIVPADAAATKTAPRTTADATAIHLRYPDGPHNAETLMIHPRSGDLYIVTKENKRPAIVYRLAAAKLGETGAQILTKIAELRLPSATKGMITGGDIAPDGMRLVLCDYFGGYEFTIPGTGAGGFDAIWNETPLIVDLGTRQQGESVCYSLDGNELFATSEGVPTPLIEVKRKGMN